MGVMKVAIIAEKNCTTHKRDGTEIHDPFITSFLTGRNLQQPIKNHGLYKIIMTISEPKSHIRAIDFFFYPTN